jgi:hypothetical protein
MKLSVYIGLFVFVCSITAQKSVSELKTSHAAALEEYLSGHTDRVFRQEYGLDDEYLKTVRIDWGFGRNFKPNYAVADFNGDGFQDFAMLLNREGKEEWSPDLEEAERIHNEYNPDYPLTLVVFNGKKGGAYRVAFTKDLMGPSAAFINISTEKKKKILYYGIFESDADTFLLAPAGKGYIIEFEKPR